MSSEWREAIKRFRVLLRWILEENFRFPVVEILVSVFVICMLIPPISETMHGCVFYGKLELELKQRFTTALIHLITSTTGIMAIVVGAIFGLNVTRDFETRRIITFLTNPVKRHEIILSKFFANILVLYAISATLVVIDMTVFMGYGAMYGNLICLALLTLLLQLFFVCSVALIISLVSKNSVLPVLGIIALHEGLRRLLDYAKSPYVLCFNFLGVDIIMRFLFDLREFRTVIGEIYFQITVDLNMFLCALFYRVFVSVF